MTLVNDADPDDVAVLEMEAVAADDAVLDGVATLDDVGGEDTVGGCEPDATLVKVSRDVAV